MFKHVRILKWTLYFAVIAGCGRIPDMPLTPLQEPPSTQPVIQPFPLPPPPLEKESIEKTYAPILHLDSRERSPLTSVDRFMAMGITLKADRKGDDVTIKENIPVQELANYPKPEIMRWGKNYKLYLEAYRQISAMENVVYTNTLESGAFTYIQYWFFYAFNDTHLLGGPPGGIAEKCGNHQGDWEHVSLRINTQQFTRATTERELFEAIDDIYFSQHTRYQFFERKWFYPNQQPVSFQKTHLNVFVANGSHASYPAPHSGSGYFLLKILGFPLHDITDGLGQVIDTTKGQLIPLREQAWLKYGGRWGGISNDGCNIVEAVSPASNDGPYGPSQDSKAIYFYQSDWYGLQRRTKYD